VAGSSVAMASAIVDRDGRTWTIDELVDVVYRAAAGDAPALATLETSFDARQSWWDRFTRDVAEQAEECLVEASATNEFGRLAIRRILERTRTELAGLRPTPLVRLAARHVAICGLEADLAHRSSAASVANNEVPPAAVQRWLDGADGRYRKALKCLADLQRLALPAVQVNVGGQQVNIATDQFNLPGRAGGPAPATAAGAQGPPLGSPTTASGSRRGARSRGRGAPADAPTDEPHDGLP
jgi:hypothetical protein